MAHVQCVGIGRASQTSTDRKYFKMERKGSATATCNVTRCDSVIDNPFIADNHTSAYIQHDLESDIV